MTKMKPSKEPKPCHPMQPIVWAKDGVIRFKKNQIVRDLLDYSTLFGFGLNEMATKEYSREDREQLAQLIGYSVSGFGDLSYCRRQVVAVTDAIAEKLYATRKRKGRA